MSEDDNGMSARLAELEEEFANLRHGYGYRQ